MDEHELFRQLTRGCRFKRPIQSNAKHRPNLVQVKKEESIDEGLPIKEESLDSADEAAIEQDQVDSFKYLTPGDDDEAPEPKKKKTKTAATEEELKKQHEAEMIATLRKENRITVQGKNIPPPVTTFEELQDAYKMPASLVENITANHHQPTPIQMQALPILLQGRPLMACAPTGSGKTIAFLAPIITELRAPQKVGFRAIVLAPTRELAQQIYRECVRLAAKTALKIHFISKVNKTAEQRYGPTGSGKCDILISTPNRVRYLLQQEPPLLNLKSVEWFVIDEADRLMEEGQNNFKEQLDEIMAACSSPTKKLALFSATYTVPVAKWALRNVKHLVRVTVGQQNSATDTVDQELLFVGSESGKLLAIRNMVQAGLKPPVLIFVQSKDRAKQLFQELLYDGINVDVIHADRTQQQRDNCVRAFREGGIWVLICTELMGRGIDFKGVNLVINYDFPQSTIAYIHRIGRTGRAGRRGRAITFFTEEDKTNLRTIAHIIKSAGGQVPDFMLTLKKPRKSEKKRLETRTPKREDISTKLRPVVEQADAKVTPAKKKPVKTQETPAKKDKKGDGTLEKKGPKKPKQLLKTKATLAKAGGQQRVTKKTKRKTQ